MVSRVWALVLLSLFVSMSAIAQTDGNTERVVICVPQVKQADAQASAAVVDPAGGEYFTRAVGAIAPPITVVTHYCVEWQMSPADKTALLSELTSRGVAAIITTKPNRDPLSQTTSVILSGSGLGFIEEPF